MLENFNKIEVKNPVDLIISQIKELISLGIVGPGEKLPPERKLATQLGVSRGQVREAINKLETYGIVKVQPQSGTIVNGTGIVALEGLITDVLKIEKADFKSLIDTRILLEKEATRLAAINRTERDIIELNIALENFTNALEKNNVAVEEDLLFHIKIAEAGKNTVLKSLMMIITPDIVKSYREYNVCGGEDNSSTIEEHKTLVDMIIRQNEQGAVRAMEYHLRAIKEFSLTFA